MIFPLKNVLARLNDILLIMFDLFVILHPNRLVEFEHKYDFGPRSASYIWTSIVILEMSNIIF